jgi:hypothetical protein
MSALRRRLFNAFSAQSLQNQGFVDMMIPELTLQQSISKIEQSETVEGEVK